MVFAYHFPWGIRNTKEHLSSPFKSHTTKQMGSSCDNRVQQSDIVKFCFTEIDILFGSGADIPLFGLSFIEGIICRIFWDN